MQCFNCGNDADMEVFMMVNGKMKKISICMSCYQEQMQGVMEAMKDENGNINPEAIQKQMFEFFQNNKEEFNKFLGEALDDAEFDISELEMENFDFSNSGFNLNDVDVNEMFSNMTRQKTEDFFKKDVERFNPFRTFEKSPGGPSPAREYNPYESHVERQVRILQNSIDKKKDELFHHIQNEDYLKAAGARDELREMNKKIMIIKRLEKEGEN